MSQNSGTFDPFAPLQLHLPDPRGTFKSSEEHVASLESKLAKLKGKNKEPSSKAMIESLALARQTHLGLMVGECSVDYVSSYLPCDEGETTPTYLDKKLHPDRIAINSEELKVLVENDELSKMHIQETSSTEEEQPESTLRQLTIIECEDSR